MAGDKSNNYRVKIPDVSVEPDLDFLLIQLPPRYMPLMPNGLAYVDLVLQRNDIKVQTLDLNIIMFHRFHAWRLSELGEPVVLPSGRVLHEDPWTPAGINDFAVPEIIDYFWHHCKQLLDAIVQAKPKVVGLTVDSTNLAICNRFIQVLRLCAPDTTVVLGGYLFLRHINPEPRVPDFDYIVIGEAEISLPPLAKALSRGEKPKDLPGIVSRYDTPDRGVVDTVYPDDITDIGYPVYHWVEPEVYSSYSGHHLVPISSSRGCAWGRCRFCSETFLYRKRDPKDVADEIGHLIDKGFNRFHFNESILGGDQSNLYKICTEFITRGFDAHFTGQIHVDKRHSVEYMKHMKKAGFHHIRFGIDAWSENTVRRQLKGYNMEMVKNSLKNCHEAGISVDVNILLGVPGETEADVDETIANLREAKDWIRGVGSYNTLNLTQGSAYFLYPEDYGIVFNGDKEKIYEKHKHFIPDSLWHSVDPYIDAKVRMDRAVRVASALHEIGMKAGAFSMKALEDKEKYLPKEQVDQQKPASPIVQDSQTV